MLKLLGRALGAALVAAVVLVPRVTIADEVSDEERMGEYDEDGQGQRFGAISVQGELVATPNSPSGWALVRTYENKTDEAAHVQVEERITRTMTIYAARVTPRPEVVMMRTQTLDLKPHEKRSIGVYVSAELGKQMTAGDKVQQGIVAMQNSGNYMGGAMDRIYPTFAVEYLRPLAKGETRAKPEYIGVDKPARMPDMAPRPILGEPDDDEPAPVAASAKVTPAQKLAVGKW